MVFTCCMVCGVGRSNSCLVEERLLVKDSSSFTKDWTHDSNELWLELVLLVGLDESMGSE
jgi:hypothetical protein